MNEMTNKAIIPAVCKDIGQCARSIEEQKELGLDVTAQMARLKQKNELLERAIKQVARLHLGIAKAQAINDDIFKKAEAFRDDVRIRMEALRGTVDALENVTDKSLWPYPGYDDLLFRL
jgi:glutamine synthetase